MSAHIALPFDVTRDDPFRGPVSVLVHATFERDGSGGWTGLRLTVDGTERPLTWLTEDEREALEEKLARACERFVVREVSHGG